MARVISACPALTSLDMSGNALGARAGEALQASIVQGGSLERLVLARAGISDCAGSRICAALIHNTTWSYVDLSGVSKPKLSCDIPCRPAALT